MALGVAPDAACALVRGRRHEHHGLAGLLHDPAHVAPDKRRVVDLAVRAGRDPIGSGASRRVEDPHLPGLGVEQTEDPVLAGEPQRPVAVERRRVETRVGPERGQREALHLARRRVDADDRVEPAIGDPRRAIGADDDPMRRRSAAELCHLRRTRLRIEPPELARELRRVPDTAVARGRDVVRSLTARDAELLHHELERARRRARWWRRDRHGRGIRRGRRRFRSRRGRTTGERDQERRREAESHPMSAVRRRSEFVTTVTDEIAIAAAARIGESSQPVTG